MISPSSFYTIKASLFVMHEIFLWIAFKQTFTGRAAEVEISTIVVCMMTSRCYFYCHTTDQVNSCLCGSRRLCVMALVSRQTTTLHLHQFGNDTGCNLFRRNCSNIEPCWRFEARYLLLRQARCAQIGTASLCTTATTNHSYVASGTG